MATGRSREGADLLSKKFPCVFAAERPLVIFVIQEDKVRPLAPEARHDLKPLARVRFKPAARDIFEGRLATGALLRRQIGDPQFATGGAVT